MRNVGKVLFSQKKNSLSSVVVIDHLCINDGFISCFSLASKDLLVAGVLQLIMGTGPYMKYSEGVTGSRLAKAIAKEVKEPFSVCCFTGILCCCLRLQA